MRACAFRLEAARQGSTWRDDRADGVPVMARISRSFRSSRAHARLSGYRGAMSALPRPGAWSLTLLWHLLLPALAAPSFAPAEEVGKPVPFEFTRLVAHWSDYGHPDYLKFIEEAQPDIAQVGFYGAHFWSLAHTEAYGGYPANFPLRGLTELGDWFEDLNRKLQVLKSKASAGETALVKVQVATLLPAVSK